MREALGLPPLPKKPCEERNVDFYEFQRTIKRKKRVSDQAVALKEQEREEESPKA